MDPRRLLQRGDAALEPAPLRAVQSRPPSADGGERPGDGTGRCAGATPRIAVRSEHGRERNRVADGSRVGGAPLSPGRVGRVRDRDRVGLPFQRSVRAPSCDANGQRGPVLREL